MRNLRSRILQMPQPYQAWDRKDMLDQMQNAIPVRCWESLPREIPLCPIQAENQQQQEGQMHREHKRHAEADRPGEERPEEGVAATVVSIAYV